MSELTQVALMMILDGTYLGNSLTAWLAALVVACATGLAARALTAVLKRRVSAHGAATEHDVDDLIVDLLQRTRLYFLVAVAIYAGSLVLDLPPRPTRLVGTVLVLAVLLQVAVWGNRLIAYAIGRYMRHTIESDAAAATTVSAFAFVGRLVLWTLIAFLALDNLGVNISALIAGLGIGGIAVALAVQNILGDVFASFSIVLDKPFVIGDFIVIGEHSGMVEHIGLKTTRIRSLSGEQIIFSNGDLLSSRVHNYKRMRERRVVFALGVTYDTPVEKLMAIPSIIRAIVESADNTRFDRAHFKAYGDYALQFEIVYFVTTPDYRAYMDAQQAINVEIYRRFQDEGIAFAFPTQTLYLGGLVHPVSLDRTGDREIG